MVHEVRLTLKKRAYPSQGRVRFNITHLPILGIREGEHVDLVNEATKKTITATVLADTVVRPGQVRVSEEDLKALGLLDEDEILVRKTIPRQEKVKKGASDAGEPLSTGVVKPDGTAVRARAVTAKPAVPLKKETAKSSEKAGTAAPKIASPARKPVKKTS